MTTWSEIVASVISCQVKVCAEGDEDCAECLRISYHPYRHHHRHVRLIKKFDKLQTQLDVYEEKVQLVK